jgi:hypothetical protein
MTTRNVIGIGMLATAAVVLFVFMAREFGTANAVLLWLLAIGGTVFLVAALTLATEPRR